ncbi:hypothetical protein B4Q13_18970, partial [Lacticaseibacillus rhamnosus]
MFFGTKPDQGKAEVLVEVCDPCLGDEFGYRIEDVLVSDFVTPAYYDGADAPFDFREHVKEPLEVLGGGSLSWHDPASGHWWQLTRFGKSEFRDLGKFDLS